MLKNKYISSVVIAILLLWNSGKVLSQDIQFSQFYAVPMYQNPAFAGSAFMHRITLHQRFQWMRLDAKFSTSYVSWDCHFDKLRGGIGIMASHDVQGIGNKLTSDDVAFLYATEIPLSGRFALRAGAQIGAAWRSIDYSRFQYAQDFNDWGYLGNSYADYGTERYVYPDISTGLVLYSDNLWVGMSAHHLTEPRQTFYNNQNNRLPMKLGVTGGYKYLLHTRKSKMDFFERTVEYSLIPTFHYKLQGKSDQLDLGLYSQLDYLLVGLWYRGLPAIKNYESIYNNESIVAMAGIKYHNLVFSYSYDFTISRLFRARTGGSHELNLTLYFQKRKKPTKPMKRLPCPDI